ncbi:hypothetical protein TD95_002657 [Thielaviopsis punctulata]|uniref:RED-like N-terminal domain-containing protein n=1 Tax=Thielaviopsis punctulata TaxID=72032 RepID=A0A0F4ZKF8_9PEZI|nr:hypothetical protein TD95_002657 [Thielaviopsis punctulata]
MTIPDPALRHSERNRQAQHQKLFKSSAPKGVKLAAGYMDRAHARHDQDEREAQIKDLEAQLKKGKIDQATFERRRDEITGGDITATHLVKGLDFKLLKRVREGEDVFNPEAHKENEEAQAQEDASSGHEDIDDELDNVLASDVAAVVREKTVKKGTLSTVAAPGKKRTRNQILADLKAARAAAKTAPADAGVGQRFKKIGAKQMPGSRIEVDSKGREVLIIVDEDGHEKRKVRKEPAGLEKQGDEAAPGKIMQPDPQAKPLGMEVPEAFQKKAQEQAEEDVDKDVDIFDDAGSDYDPLAGLGSGSDSGSDSDEEGETKDSVPAPSANPTPAPQPSAPRNYFKDAKTGLASEQTLQGPSWSDPSLQAVLKKAATLQPRDGDADSGSESDEEARARREKRRRMLQADDRDAADMDMGFGTSRFEDEEDFDDGGKVRLAKWTGTTSKGDGSDNGADEAAYKERGGKTQRKRGGKKRKGDGNNAADVMRIVEQRRRAEGK